MPRVTKKERRLVRCENMAVNDVTLSDFANASMNNPSAHVKKSIVNAKLDAKILGMASKHGKEDLSWFEKDLDDFEILDENVEEEKTEESSSLEQLTSPKKGSKVKKGKQLCIKKGIDYPVDLWYQLSYYIYPESVSTFARICKSTNRIVCTVSFWKNLYQKYYNQKIKLPKSLQPLCLERVHSLQPNVVRALYYFYQPFIEKVTPTSSEDEPHKLIGRRCLLFWYQPVKNLWNFCFKLVRPGVNSHAVCTTQRQYIDTYDNIFYNNEEGCAILQVTCSHFLSLPIVMGQVLNRVYLTVSGQGFRYHTLRLVFDTRYQHNRDAVGTVVTLDSVVNVRVIPWWDPKYPFTT